MSDIVYAPAVGNKFYEDGTVRQFPGNTVICFVDPQSAVYAHCDWMQEQLRSLPFAHKFTLLPMPSMHMTVFEFITDATRMPEKWSSHLALDASLEETDAYFIKTFAQVPPPNGFQMVFDKVRSGAVGISIRLRPANDESALRLKQYRDALAKTTGVRFPDHESYVFHISLAYHIQRQTDEEAAQFAALLADINEKMRDAFGVFQTGQPQLTFFDDMFEFVPTEKRHMLKSRQG